MTAPRIDVVDPTITAFLRLLTDKELSLMQIAFPELPAGSSRLHPAIRIEIARRLLAMH